jgi:hypothetical protein
MSYGHENGKFSFRAFDVTVDGKYLSHDAKVCAHGPGYERIGWVSSWLAATATALGHL